VSNDAEKLLFVDEIASDANFKGLKDVSFDYLK